jgi:4-amino-4-deoxy-L-arabinose transferase-like glycosyltransferase
LPRSPVVWALAAILAFFLATRLALLWRFPPFLDEANYAVWAKDVHDSGEDRFIALANGRGPLFSWLGALVIWLGAAPLTAVRLISICSGLVSLGCVGLLGRRLGGIWTGVTAAGLYAVVPYFLVHDSIGLFEPLVTALALLALVLQLRLAEAPRLDLALLLGITLGAGLLAKESARFALVLLPATLLCFDWSKHDLGRRLLRWVGASLLAVAIAGALYSIMKLSPLYAQLGAAKSATEPIRSYGSALRHPLRWLNTNWPGDRTNFLGYVTGPLLVLAAIGIGLGLRQRWRYSLLLLLWLLIPLGVAALLVENTFARYTLQAVPPLVVFAAFGLVQALRIVSGLRVPVRALAAGVAAGVALLLLPAFIFDGKVLADPNRADYPGTSDDEYATGWPAGNAWVAVAHEIDRLAGDGTTSVTVYDQGSNAFPLSLHTQLTPAGDNARYVIENGRPIPDQHGPGELRPIWEYHRPRNGVVLRLYERGVTVGGRFYTTPAELRSGLGLGDKEFDAFVASHPEVKAWYDGVVSVGS